MKDHIEAFQAFLFFPLLLLKWLSAEIKLKYVSSKWMVISESSRICLYELCTFLISAFSSIYQGQECIQYISNSRWRMLLDSNLFIFPCIWSYGPVSTYNFTVNADFWLEQVLVKHLLISCSIHGASDADKLSTSSWAGLDVHQIVCFSFRPDCSNLLIIPQNHFSRSRRIFWSGLPQKRLPSGHSPIDAGSVEVCRGSSVSTSQLCNPFSVVDGLLDTSDSCPSWPGTQFGLILVESGSCHIFFFLHFVIMGFTVLLGI